MLFAVSPLEEHGPHLPIGTDLFHAEYFSEELAKRIIEANTGWTVLIGPSLPIGASAFDQAGTLLARARTVRNATLDYGAALARHGFRYILVTNGHAGPRHVVALEEAAAVVSRRYGARMLSLSGPVLWKFLRGKFNDRLEPLLGRPLTEAEREAMRGDAHGGTPNSLPRAFRSWTRCARTIPCAWGIGWDTSALRLPPARSSGSWRGGCSWMWSGTWSARCSTPGMKAGSRRPSYTRSHSCGLRSLTGCWSWECCSPDSCWSSGCGRKAEVRSQKSEVRS
ncbi:MAG: hypothetical protein DMG26_14420 [Acidobacteria bacterium]|nr:MAG: hypothetical protein DMG26_14420 [Acidobacteriota bacterium]